MLACRKTRSHYDISQCDSSYSNTNLFHDGWKIFLEYVLHFSSYFFTGFIGSFVNYLTYVVLLIGYLTYVLTDKLQLIYWFCLFVTGFWYRMQTDNPKAFWLLKNVLFLFFLVFLAFFLLFHADSSWDIFLCWSISMILLSR